MSTYKTLKHPFGFDDGERVVPAEVADGETVACPRDGCDKSLHVRGPSTNGTVRHFYHPNSSGNGGGGAHDGGGTGESATHKNYKSHAASALLTFFGEFIEESTTEEIFEQRVPIPHESRYRQADTLVTFESPSATYGKGIIIEVQHANHGKDKETVEREYLEAGYSVYWTNSEDHYTPKKHLFDRDQLDEEIVTVWPNAVPESAEWESHNYSFHLLHPRQGYAVPSTLRNIASYVYGVEFDTVSVERTVTLPREWYEERVRQYFRETSWDDLFTEYEWDARTSLPMPDNGAKRNQHTSARLPLTNWLADDVVYLTQYEREFRSGTTWTRTHASKFTGAPAPNSDEVQNGHRVRRAILQTRLIPEEFAGFVGVTNRNWLTDPPEPEPPKQLEPSDVEVRKPSTPDAEDADLIHKNDGGTCDPDEHHIVASGSVRYCERCGTSTQTLVEHPEIDPATLLKGVV